MNDVAISASGVWKNFRLYHERNRFIKAAVLRGRRARFEEFWALQDVSFEIRTGSTFGIIGANGSGKSTMLKCLAGILYPNRGSVTVKGRLSALLELGAGFHPELTGRENIYLNGAILGMSRRDIDGKYDNIVQFAGLEKFIDTPVKNFSSGMAVRLGFSIASHVDPEILLIDEVLSVGDQSFQRKSLEKIEEFRRDGRTIVFVTHALSQVQQLCKDVAWLDKGQLRRIGPAADVLAEYTGDSYEVHASSESTVGKRWGNGKATISSVFFKDLKGNRTEVIDSGEDLVVAVDFTANSLLEEIVVYLKISHLNGTEIWATSSRNNGLALPHVIGRRSINVHLPRLPLLEGSYLLTVALRNGRETVEFDHWENGHKFDVHQVNRLDEGLVRIDAKWSEA